MIDTTTWKVQVTEEQFNKIISRSKEYVEYDHELKQTGFRILRSNLHIGSYDSNITLKCFESQTVSLEFSVPKQHGGNNVELLYPSRLEQTLLSVHTNLLKHFGDFPSYKNWYLTRLDLCYAWKMRDQKTAVDALKTLKTFDYPRKFKFLYKEAVMWRGKYFSLKFYLKEPEFIKHDFKELVKKGFEEFAKQIGILSSGVLRFEITFRKEAINNLFGKKLITYKDLLDKEKLENTLSEYLNKLLLHLDQTVMDDKQVLECLRKTYSNRKALRLFVFYMLYNSEKINHRQILIDHYNPSTIWRNKCDIAKAGVGLPDQNLSTFTLNIPSELVVNKDLS